MSQGICTINDCDKPLRSPGAQWCSKHYHRWYRHGSPFKKPYGNNNYQRRYLQIWKPEHPLAMANGKVYEHRLVLFDRIGWGPHDCHWCGTALHWKAQPGQTGLDVDHLDRDHTNNDLANLVPSCRPCNTGRGSQAKHSELVADGYWSSHDTIQQSEGRSEAIA